jgi:hypothetical protein
VARMWEKRNTCSILVGKREGKGPLGRCRRTFEDNIKMNVKEKGCGLGWSGSG